jgi:hypothetical protein
MARAARLGTQASHLHFPVLFGDRCVKKVLSSRTERLCGQDRDGANHLFYRCRTSAWCTARFLSIEARIGHEKEDHNSVEPVEGYR